MKKTLFTLVSTLLLGAWCAPAAWAQDRIYRCGNEYTNNVSQAKERGCKLVEGGNVTVLQSSRPAATASSSSSSSSAGQGSSASSASSPANAPRVDSNAQRARDSDARAIFEAELRKAESRLAELNKEYNNGAPERNALDLRNPQHYSERTAEIKANMGRTASDIESIRRELGRVGSR
ncbi:hypothetical protein [Simplicispira psychrophila]|uniref:hypothetical protein n=1 Tax=Simplicispira psychrophila TaxID=80882 RepID=UPI0004802478|nr:hypothetical protein [Simplicispira psychrophila]